MKFYQVMAVCTLIYRSEKKSRATVVMKCWRCVKGCAKAFKINDTVS